MGRGLWRNALRTYRNLRLEEDASVRVCVAVLWVPECAGIGRQGGGAREGAAVCPCCVTLPRPLCDCPGVNARHVPSHLHGGEGHYGAEEGTSWAEGLTAGQSSLMGASLFCPVPLGQQSSWSFKVLARAGRLLGGRPPEAEMVQSFQGALGAIFSVLG